MHRGLGVVEKNELADAEPSQLAAKFGTDGTGGTGHQHHLVLEIGLDCAQVDPDLLPAEQVLDADLANLEVVGTGIQFIHRRSDQHLDPQFRAGADQVVLFSGNILLIRKDHPTQRQTVYLLFELLFILEVIDDFVRQQGVLNLRRIGDQTDHIVALGSPQAGGRGHGLIIDAVHQYTGATLQVADLGLVGIEGIDHHQAHRQERNKRHEHIGEQHCNDDGLNKVKTQQNQGHYEPLAQGGAAEYEGIFERKMPDDDDVGLEKPEHQGRSDKSGNPPDQIEGTNQDNVLIKQEGQDRYCDRDDDRNEKIHHEDLSPAQEFGTEFVQVLTQIQHKTYRLNGVCLIILQK